MRGARGRFVAVFLLLLALFEIPLLLDSFDRAVIRPFTTALTALSGGLIALFEAGVTVSGTVISAPCFAVDIRNGCNGIEATLFLLAAVLAFPAPLRMRLTGALAGVATVQGANLLRIVTLFMIGCRRPRWFETFHLAVWQTLIFAVAVGVFLLWTRRVALVSDAARA